MTAALAPKLFLDRAAAVGDRVRWPGSDCQVAWVGEVVDRDPFETGVLRCEVPGIPGLVRVPVDRLQVLAGAR